MKSKILFFLIFLTCLSIANASEPDNIVSFLQKISGTLSPSKDDGNNTVKTGAQRKRKSSGDPAIQNILTAGNFLDNNADGIASVFPENIPVIYVCFEYSGFKSGEVVQSIWYRAKGKADWDEIADDSVTIPFSGASNVCELHHGVPAGTKWKPGAYKVDIIARSRIIGSASFSISDSSMSGASTVLQGFDLASPVPEQDGSFQFRTMETPVEPQSRYSVVKKAADTDVPKLNYQGSPGGGVFNGDGFSIDYQNGWKYVQAAPGTVIFTNFDGEANVILQKAASRSNGGAYSDIAAAIADTEGKLRAFQDSSINNENEFTLHNVSCKPFSAHYIQRGKPLREWYVIRVSPDNKFFYLFRYSSSPEKYNKYIGTARMMFSSLVLNAESAGKKAPPSVPPPDAEQSE